MPNDSCAKTRSGIAPNWDFFFDTTRVEMLSMLDTIVPMQGPDHGGTVLWLKSESFALMPFNEDPVVFIGNVRCANVTRMSTTFLQVTTPPYDLHGRCEEMLQIKISLSNGLYKHFEYIFYRPDDDFYLNLIGP